MDVIKPHYIVYQLKEGNTSRYMCFDEEGEKYISFDPKTERMMLKSDHKECKVREFGLDVIKDFDFDISIPAQVDKGTDKQELPIQKLVKDQSGPFLLLLSFFVLSLFLERLGLQNAGNCWEGQTVKGAIIRIAQTILVPLLIFSMFWAFYCLGHRAAKNDFNEQVRADFPSYPRVSVWAEPPKDFSAGDKIGDKWQKGCYRLLMRNKDHPSG